MLLRGSQFDETINAATKELVSYCLLSLGVNRATHDVTHILDTLDLAAHNTLPERSASPSSADAH